MEFSPLSQTNFASLKLNPALIENLTSLEYREMTPIQAQSLPPILEGRDVIAQSKTGSGKTAAFGLGLLHGVDTKTFRVQSLVLCPTRELADQVAQEIRRLARTLPNIKVLTLCGGTAFGPQRGSLEHGAHIIVGTPGRVEEHLRKATLNLEQMKMLVLDEADRMLDMGFQAALDAILEYIPHTHQTLLFSATYPEQIQSIAKRIMTRPEHVQQDTTHDSSSILQHLYKIDNDKERLTALRLLLLKHRPQSAIVFCNTKLETQEVADALAETGFYVMALHGDMQQRERDQTMVQFSNKSVSILVATDVAARGLDIDNLDAVINYHIARDVEVHTHRIGRTGRAGSKGLACTLYAEKETHKIERLTNYLGEVMAIETLPAITLLQTPVYKPAMATLQIDGGKKQKVRAGDILGALTNDKTIDAQQVGKIQIFENTAYVAIKREVVKAALKKMTDEKLKGRSFRVRQL